MKTVTCRIPEEKVAALDRIADCQQRDRRFIIDEALSNYLWLHEEQRKLIENRVQMLESSAKTIDHDAVMKTIANKAKRARQKIG